MTLVQTFGRNVRREREAKGITLEGLAHDVGLSYSYVGGIERGQRNPTLAVIERISAALDIPSLDLLSNRRT
jgi:transcriptional regulator with XRE-family HTH domain